MSELLEAAKRLVAHIEGPGCVDYRRGDGWRIKDSTEWAAFYVAVKDAGQTEQTAWKLVPVEPTEDQIRAFLKAYGGPVTYPEMDPQLRVNITKVHNMRARPLAERLYAAMLAAAPAPPTAETQKENGND